MTESYCPRCGAENEIEQRAAGRFDTDFGWPIYETRLVCPNKRFPFDGHSRSGWEDWEDDPKYIRASTDSTEEPDANKA